MKIFFLERLKDKTLQDAISFIEESEEKEANCVELMSRLLDDSWKLSVYSYFILYEGESLFKKKILAIFMKSTGGLLQFCIPQPERFLKSRKFARAVKSLFEGKLYCIMGEKSAAKLIAKIAEKYAPENHLNEERDYLLLSYHPENLPDGLIERKFDYEPIKCGQDDSEKLFELHKQYNIVEVFPKGKEYSADICRRTLELMLKKQMTYAIEQDGQFVAKAGSNAIGKNFVQLGGVYTDEKYRSKGMAQCLVDFISRQVVLEGKKPVLFVRTKNESAKKAYRKVGYIYQNDYAILYY